MQGTIPWTRAAEQLEHHDGRRWRQLVISTTTAMSSSKKRGEGEDTLFASVNFALADGVENLTLTGSRNMRGVGNAQDNEIAGNAGDNLLTGGLGADAHGQLGTDRFEWLTVAQSPATGRRWGCGHRLRLRRWRPPRAAQDRCRPRALGQAGLQVHRRSCFQRHRRHGAASLRRRSACSTAAWMAMRTPSSRWN